VVDAPEHRPESRQVAWLCVRIALIANAASGGGLDPEELAERMRRHGADVRAFGCEPEQLEPAVAWAPERVAVAGGDGTVGTAAELAGRLGVPLAVIPTGTANDYARASELPDDPEDACALAATGGELRPMELGRLADGRPFVNVASAGLASAAARRAEPFKSFLGPLAYPVGALHAAMTEPPLRCTVCAGGEEVFDGEAWQAIVAVTGAFGGGADIDAADPEDGVLDAAILPAGSRLGLARRAWGLRRGTIAEQRDVRHARGTVVEVGLPPGTEFNVDGEVHDSGMERITVEHRAYDLVIG
jgi:diacylglycerol kinase family enzyme